LGGFGHPPNADGLFWFVQAIWPAIRSAVPKTRLTVVGSHPTPEVEALTQLEGIDVIGYAADLQPYLDSASLMVAPLRYGAGLKIKVTEALASRLAVVTTTVGAQGLDAVSGKQLLIADEPEEFAQRVIELLGNPERTEQIGRAGHDYITSTCSSKAIDASLDSMLAAVVDRGRPVIPPPDWLVKSAIHYVYRGARRTFKCMRVYMNDLFKDSYGDEGRGVNSA
jgi:hypothetical protein